MQSEQWTNQKKLGNFAMQGAMGQRGTDSLAFDRQFSKKYGGKKVPVKQSIDNLRGQIQALQQLSMMGGID